MVERLPATARDVLRPGRDRRACHADRETVGRRAAQKAPSIGLSRAARRRHQAAVRNVFLNARTLSWLATTPAYCRSTIARTSAGRSCLSALAYCAFA